MCVFLTVITNKEFILFDQRVPVAADRHHKPPVVHNIQPAVVPVLLPVEALLDQRPVVRLPVTVAQADPPRAVPSSRHQGQQGVHLLRVVHGQQVEAPRPAVALSVRPRLGAWDEAVTEAAAAQGGEAQACGGERSPVRLSAERGRIRPHEEGEMFALSLESRRWEKVFTA